MKGSGTRMFSWILAIMVLIWGLTGVSWAQDFEFKTDLSRYEIDSKGASKGIIDNKSGHQWLSAAPLPFSTISKAGISYPISSLKQNGELLQGNFGSSGVEANFRVSIHPHYLVFELVSLQGEGVEGVQLMQLTPVPLENAGGVIACRWNDKFAICLMALSNRVNSALTANNVISSSVVPQFGMQGEKVALIAVPSSRFMEVVQEIERDYNLPSPKIGGYWAKQSPDVRTSYLFTDLTEGNAEETIKFAKLGGFKYILVYWSTWASSAGSYPINRNSFPDGEESLKATIDKCHAAGLKVGMHMMTSLITKNDPLVHPIPDSRLLKDVIATLSSDLSSDADEIVATSRLNALPAGQPLHYGGKAGADIQIDNEIIHYGQFVKNNMNMFSGCIRGYSGTKSAPHKAGARIYRLVEGYGYYYMADMRTSFQDQIADRVAGVINRCGFDMIYFDGGGASAANGPFWHWVGQQQMNIWKRVNRELLIQCSELTHWTWHLSSRIACNDYAAIWPTQWLDFHKVKTLEALKKEFMPAELGWWGLLDNGFDHPATLPDEVEHCGLRMLAFDAPVSIETNYRSLKANGRTGEILERLGQLEQLRLSNTIPLETRRKLAKGHWDIVEEGGQTHFYPIDRKMLRVTLPSEIDIHNPGKAQGLKFRLSALPSLASMGDSANIVLFHPNQPLELKMPQSISDRTGVLAAQIDLFESLKQKSADRQKKQPPEARRTLLERVPPDLHRHRGLAISLKVDSVQTNKTGPAPVLNVQLQDAGSMYRDYYINLDFTGEKTFILPETTAGRLLTEFTPTGYNHKMAMYVFNYSEIVALNFRWMRLPKEQSFSCSVGKVEALAETERTLSGLDVAVGDRNLAIPVSLPSGSYIEAGSGNLLRLFDQNGNLVTSIESNPDGWPILQPGENKVKIRSSVPGQVRLLITTLGNACN